MFVRESVSEQQRHRETRRKGKAFVSRLERGRKEEEKKKNHHVYSEEAKRKGK